MIFKFKTVTIKNRKFHIIINIIIGISILLFVITLYLKSYRIVPIIFIAMIILGFIDNKYSKYKFNGYLFFDEKECRLEKGPTYKYEFIDKIVIVFTSIKGDYTDIPARGLPIAMRLKGVDNHIKIIYKKEKIKYSIYCETKRDYFNLKEVEKFLKNKGLSVKMKIGKL
ncbi:MAG: hypothetical protein PHF49_04135 [Patescibacteria group bacterium]|jgi:hypothetical protein|nr:hypothetical protein [Patescibacteria group bacterium]